MHHFPDSKESFEDFGDAQVDWANMEFVVVELEVGDAVSVGLVVANYVADVGGICLHFAVTDAALRAVVEYDAFFDYH